MAEYLIVTGMSGAGRSSAAATLEDLGWFVIDNVPPKLIGRVAELAAHPGSDLDRFCFVAGRGGAESTYELSPAIHSLRASGARVRVLFLDATDEVLVRRFEGTRRRHPLEAESVLDAIRQERAQLVEVRNDADEVVDTSETNVHDLHDRLVELFAFSGAAVAMETSLVSFGFKFGLPLDVDLVFDCRFLPNPHWIEELRDKTGLDASVRRYVLSSPDAIAFIDKLDDLFGFLLPAYAREGKAYLSIAIGCTGGHHRSVVLAEELAKRMTAHNYRPSVHHRDIDR